MNGDEHFRFCIRIPPVERSRYVGLWRQGWVLILFFCLLTQGYGRSEDTEGVKRDVALRLKPLWKVEVGFPIDSLVCHKGYVLVGSQLEATMYALDLSDGKIVWKRLLPGALVNPPVFWETIVLTAPFASGVLALRLETGGDLWVVTPRFPEVDPFRAFKAPLLIRAPLVVAGSKVISVAESGLITGYDRRGNQVGSLQLGPWSRGEKIVARPFLQGSVMFLASTAGNLWEVDLSGFSLLHRFVLPGKSVSSYPGASEVWGPVVGGAGKILVGTLGGYLHCFEVKDKKRVVYLWGKGVGDGGLQVTPGGRAVAVPVVARRNIDGKAALFVSTLKKIYCLDLDSGRVRWVRPTPSVPGGEVVLWKHYIIWTGEGGILYVYRQTDGLIQEKFVVRNPIRSGPIMVDDVLLLGYGDGVIEAYKVYPVPSKARSR